ncbi:MucBP domain-containing protein [Enterococcus thailandicus]|uniref:MucBP domain-containing protein n=1 Tax=Enterococcus thailandicus TaxID=417368 RepID=UPI0035D5B8A1
MKRIKKKTFKTIGISSMLLLSVSSSLVGSSVSVFAESSKEVLEKTISSTDPTNEKVTVDTTSTSEMSTSETKTSTDPTTDKTITTDTTTDTTTEASDDDQKINTVSLEDGSVSYSADANEYSKGGSYEGTVHLTNKDGNSIPIGTKIVITFPLDGIDINSLVLSDPIIAEYFNVTKDPATGVVTFELKKEIVGDADISFVVAGTIIGEEGKSYDVNIASSDPDGTTHAVNNANPNFKVKDDGENPPPAYGLANAYWGISDSDGGNFIGKNGTDVEGLPTGMFGRGSDAIQNFVEANPLMNYRLGPDDFYTIIWQITPFDGEGNRVTDANVTVNPDEIKLYTRWSTGALHEINSDEYKLNIETYGNIKKVTATFRTANEGGKLGTGVRIMMSTQAHVDDDSLTYHTGSWVYKTNKVTNETITANFGLNNLFSSEGESTIFPNLTVEDKTFYTGYLNDSNIKEEIMKNITAKDTNDGDITKDITVDYSQVNPNVVGDYPVEYTVTNSTSHTAKKTAIIHIIEKEEAAPVTVMYLDEDGNEIAPNKVLTGKIDDPYQTEALTIDGYQLLTTPDNATGKYTDQAQTVKYVYRGNLLFVEAPETISFGEHPLSGNDETYPIQDKKNDLKIQDFRKLGSQWSVTAQLTQEFTGKQTGRKLDGTLNYKDENGVVQTINSANSAMIYSKQTENHDVTDISQNWNDDFGLFLHVKSGGAVLDEYDATIQWTVEDTVSNN